MSWCWWWWWYWTNGADGWPLWTVELGADAWMQHLKYEKPKAKVDAHHFDWLEWVLPECLKMVMESFAVCCSSIFSTKRLTMTFIFICTYLCFIDSWLSFCWTRREHQCGEQRGFSWGIAIPDSAQEGQGNRAYQPLWYIACGRDTLVSQLTAYWITSKWIHSLWFL